MYTTADVLPHLRLRFHVEHPGLEECYHEGIVAAQADVEEDENPYPQNTPEFEYWCEGWWDGFYENEQMLDTEIISSSQEKKVLNDTVAANEDKFDNSGVALWATRVAKIAGVIAIAVAAFELFDLAS